MRGAGPRLLVEPLVVVPSRDSPTHSIDCARCFLYGSGSGAVRG